jgi:hypothetical protein
LQSNSFFVSQNYTRPFEKIPKSSPYRPAKNDESVHQLVRHISWVILWHSFIPRVSSYYNLFLNIPSQFRANIPLILWIHPIARFPLNVSELQWRKLANVKLRRSPSDRNCPFTKPLLGFSFTNSGSESNPSDWWHSWHWKPNQSLSLEETFPFSSEDRWSSNVLASKTYFC